jgi:CheY-like chemotaxis protein
MSTQGHPICIVLADDDEDDRTATRDGFARNRMANDFRTVNDGEELMAFLRREGKYVDAPRPGLILLDLNMPKKDGREALSEIKRDPALRSIPIVVLTTSSQEEDILRSYGPGRELVHHEARHLRRPREGARCAWGVLGPGGPIAPRHRVVETAGGQQPCPRSPRR